MNNLGDLNQYLFEQLDRLNDDKLKGEELKEVIERGKAITDVGKTIIQNANLVLQAKKMVDNRMDADLKLPKMLDSDI